MSNIDNKRAEKRIKRLKTKKLFLEYKSEHATVLIRYMDELLIEANKTIKNREKQLKKLKKQIKKLKQMAGEQAVRIACKGDNNLI